MYEITMGMMIGLAGLIIVDLIFYALAKFPERTTNWKYKLPFGGFMAYFKYGHNLRKR